VEAELKNSIPERSQKSKDSSYSKVIGKAPRNKQFKIISCKEMVLQKTRTKSRRCCLNQKAK